MGRRLTAMQGTDEAVLRVGDLEIHAAEGFAVVGDRSVALSAREVGVLGALATRFGRTVTREDLYRMVWGTNLRPGDRSIDVYVSRLRGKLEAARPGWCFIHTHVGFGYRLAPQPFTTVSHPDDHPVTR
jgi:DNA-binding response OmpR family regulator